MRQIAKVSLTPEQLSAIAQGKEVTLPIGLGELSCKEASRASGGLFEDYNPPTDFSEDGGPWNNNSPFDGMSIGITIGAGPFSVGVDLGSCKAP